MTLCCHCYRYCACPNAGVVCGEFKNWKDCLKKGKDMSIDAPYAKALESEDAPPKCPRLHNHWCHTRRMDNESCLACLVEKYATAKDEAASQGSRVRGLVNENIMLKGKVKELSKHK